MATALPAASQNGSGDGQWLVLPRRIQFTFAGMFVGAVNFRCLTLVGPLGGQAYPLTSSLFDLLPDGVRALHICSQTISARLPRVSRLGPGICYVPLQGKRFFIDLNGSFEAYLGNFSAKTRNTMRRKTRRFAQASNGAMQWREFRDAKEMAEFHGLACEVSGKGYQHRLLRAGIDPSPSFREEMVRGAIEGTIRGYVLFRQQTPAAYMFCQARCGDLVVEKMGYDPLYATDSPGLVLLCLALRQLFAGDGFRRLDLGEGEYPYKAHLATGSVHVAEIYCFPWNLRNAAFVVMHSAVAAAASLFRSALQLLGVARGLKKMIRHGIGRARRG
ncbi:MAG TPA: GNAT family N-acetyltransferase [bacterium]|nr:GNAT family N-acetyltransferase [bacterium]